MRSATRAACTLFTLFAASAAFTGLSGPASAGTITFNAGPTQNGFHYSTASGVLFLNVYGNPGADMEGDSSGGGGVLDIVRVGGGDFTFSQLDFSVFGLPTISHSLTVTGFLGGVEVNADVYTLAGDFHLPYENWTTEDASNLAGLTLDDLKITLSAAVSASDTFSDNIDNVVLNPITATGVPEPITLSIFGAGVVGATAMRRRKAKSA